MDNLQQVIHALKELEQDPYTPKRVKMKITSTLKTLSDNSEVSIKASKALHELEGIADDASVESNTRTQIFNIVSLLEVV